MFDIGLLDFLDQWSILASWILKLNFFLLTSFEKLRNLSIIALVLCKAQLQAVKPWLLRPESLNRAGPCWRLCRAQGSACTWQSPEPGPEAVALKMLCKSCAWPSYQVQTYDYIINQHVDCSIMFNFQLHHWCVRCLPPIGEFFFSYKLILLFIF